MLGNYARSADALAEQGANVIIASRNLDACKKKCEQMSGPTDARRPQRGDEARLCCEEVTPDARAE